MVTVFVVPEKMLNEPLPAVRYKLDAFFSPDVEIKEYKKSGGEDSKIIAGSGFQEFGMAVVSDEDPGGKPQFMKLTTGETGSRVLSCPVYGPFMRVTLKNLTEGDRRKFKIVAYLSR